MQRHSPFVPTPCATAGCHCGGWGWEEGPRALGLGVSFPHPELEVRGWSGFSGLGRRARPCVPAASHACPSRLCQCLPWGAPQVNQSGCRATRCSSQALGTRNTGCRARLMLARG